MMTVVETHRGLKEIALADMGMYFRTNEDGEQTIKSFDEMTPDMRRAIKSAEFDKFGNITKFALEPKTPVLSKVADIQGLVTSKVEITVSDSMVFEFFGRAFAKHGIDEDTVKKIVQEVAQMIEQMPKPTKGG
jgi:hypothetical protein